MKKIIIIPDSFKGTMRSTEICGLIEKEVRRAYPDIAILSIPVADGGEGTVDAFLSALPGERVSTIVKNPYMEDMTCTYGILEHSSTAVIEMASCAGLPLVTGRRDPSRTTTFGVGQMMRDAAERGCRNMIIGLGGSCTNDCGAGAAAACGIRFLDRSGNAFLPAGGSLCRVTHIDVSGLDPLLKQCRITAMCDIDSPLAGINGAAYLFAPQKGADPAMVKQLDDGLKSISAVMEQDLGQKTATLPGAGAAGGMGAGMHAFFGAGLKNGIEILLDTVSFDDLARDADLIISGEGRLDTQSLRGKAVIGTARRAKKLGVPLIAVVGDVRGDVSAVYKEGVTAVFSTNREAIPSAEAKKRSREDLVLTIENLMRLLAGLHV